MDKCAECNSGDEREDETVKTCQVCGQEIHPECFEKFHKHVEVPTKVSEEKKEEKDEIESLAEEHEFEGETIPFVPDHIISEITTMLLIIVLISLMVIFIETPLETVANPLQTPEDIKPEWYFLFLFAFLHYVPTQVGIFAPLLGVIFIFFLPWIDRSPSRKLKDRKLAIAITFILLIFIAIFTYIGEYIV